LQGVCTVVNSAATVVDNIDWSQFKAYLLSRMIERTAAQRIRYAKAYHTILLQPTDDKLQMVLQFAPDKRVLSLVEFR
jgi:hypothetical protein